MSTTNEQSAAYAQVQIKVSELQDALIALQATNPETNVGLQEWCNDLDVTMYDLAADLFE